MPISGSGVVWHVFAGFVHRRVCLRVNCGEKAGEGDSDCEPERIVFEAAGRLC